MPPSPLARLRKLCLSLPEAHEVEAWGEPTFRVKNKIFAIGPGGWIGVWLDGDCDWNELKDLLRDGYRMTAPKKLLALVKDD